MTLLLLRHHRLLRSYAAVFCGLYLLAVLATRSINPIAFFVEWSASIDANDTIMALSDRRREAVEELLVGWSQQIEPPGIPFGVYAPSPGCYTVRYTLRGDAKVWVMYDAHDRRIASQDND